jgi:hypothetical protein
VKPFVEDRPRQTLPEQIVADLLGAIRGQFCAELPVKEWCQQKRFFMRVVLYPAQWLSRRGVTLPPERYKAVLLGVFDGIKTHGQTASVKFWPGYLLHCVQEHFKHKGDAIYEEAKSARAAAERALSKAAVRPSADPVEALAQAASVLRLTARRRPAPRLPAQPSLL